MYFPLRRKLFIFWKLIPKIWHMVPHYLVPGTWNLAPDSWNLRTWHLTLGTLHLTPGSCTPGIWNLASHTWHLPFKPADKFLIAISYFKTVKLAKIVNEVTPCRNLEIIQVGIHFSVFPLCIFRSFRLFIKNNNKISDG